MFEQDRSRPSWFGEVVAKIRGAVEDRRARHLAGALLTELGMRGDGVPGAPDAVSVPLRMPASSAVVGKVGGLLGPEVVVIHVGPNPDNGHQRTLRATPKPQSAE